IKPGPFLRLMGRVGGYNHLKQVGVGTTIFGQILVGGLGGLVYGLTMRQREQPSSWATLGVFFLLPMVVFAALLFPVLGTSYHGWPIKPATFLVLLGLAGAFLAFERTLVFAFRYLKGESNQPNELEYSPLIRRRALLLGALGLLVTGGGVGILRRLYQMATFSYDGTQYRGAEVQPITPN